MWTTLSYSTSTSASSSSVTQPGCRIAYKRTPFSTYSAGIDCCGMTASALKQREAEQERQRREAELQRAFDDVFGE